MGDIWLPVSQCGHGGAAGPASGSQLESASTIDLASRSTSLGSMPSAKG